ncbi:MAG: serine/threonine-protein kinase [Sandaracinus sp.]
MPDSNARISTRFRRAPTRYVPLQRLAAGGMAEVWKGNAIFETGDKHLVAIKRVLPQLAQDQTYKSMFEDEARLGMLLRHPNIVRVYDGREVGGTFIMIMELVEGTSLKAILERAHARGAGMPPATALFVARQLASALAYAHAARDPSGQPLGIIHRDVSPHNLLLGKDGAVKLADFGLADASVHSTQLGGGMLGGKLGYLAPEIIEQQPSTAQIDVFAAGIVLWEMLAGRRLFQGEDDVATVRCVAKCEVAPPSRFNRRATPEVDALVMRVLDRDPKRRTPGAEALVADLDRVLARLDPNVSQRDVALVVGLHLATEPQPKPASAAQSAAAFMEELDAFVAQAGEGDLGAAPLDPDMFARRF